MFLDSSVVLAACLSSTGAAREVFRLSASGGWRLLVSPWVLRETNANLADKPLEAVRTWVGLRSLLTVEDDELTFDWPTLFTVAKDKPVLFSALASADVLLTLDRRDFRDLLGETIYDLRVSTPGDFLGQERAAGRLPRAGTKR